MTGWFFKYAKERERVVAGTLWLLLVTVGCATGARNEALLRARAESGDSLAQRTLGEEFDFRLRNYEEAAKWYEKAADQGDAYAQNALGSLYQHGQGVPRNFEMAVELYRKAAAQGHDRAQSNLGYMYDYGLGVPEDKTEANRWYRVAAEQGHPEAMLNLSVNYRGGWGVERDLVQSYMWIDLARWLTQLSRDMKTKWKIRAFQDDLVKDMTRQEIRTGEKLATEWSRQFMARKKKR